MRAKNWRRRLLRSPWLRNLFCWFVHCYIRFVFLTNRWRIEGADPRRRIGEGDVLIGAFWHGRMMLLPMAWQRMAPVHMLISSHRDGRLIAGAIRYFGVESIDIVPTRGGGLSALRAMLKRLGEGECVAITPDGPRGPAMTASAGIVNLARLAGVPIQPVTYATSRRRLLATWDRFHLALPFGRGVILWGEPIEIAADLDAQGIEDARRLVETRMIEMVREADRLVGHGVADPVAPGRQLAETQR